MTVHSKAGGRGPVKEVLCFDSISSPMRCSHQVSLVETALLMGRRHSGLFVGTVCGHPFNPILEFAFKFIVIIIDNLRQTFPV